MNIKRKPLFLRKESNKKSRLGFRRKKLLRWVRQKGGDSKIRLRMKGYRKQPSIGYGANKKTHNLVKVSDKLYTPLLIFNAKDLDNIKENQVAIIAHTSKKNKIEIAKKAQEKGIKIQNLNIKKFLKKYDKKIENKTDNKKQGEIKK